MVIKSIGKKKGGIIRVEADIENTDHLNTAAGIFKGAGKPEWFKILASTKGFDVRTTGGTFFEKFDIPQSTGMAVFQGAIVSLQVDSYFV